MRKTPPEGRKSSFSGYASECVMVTDHGFGIVGVHDSKHPDGARLVMTSEEFGGWVDSIKAGEFNDLAD